jgi:hypothetical protein
MEEREKGAVLKEEWSPCTEKGGKRTRRRVMYPVYTGRG